MKISIAPDVFVKFPQLKVGLLVASNVDNKSKLARSTHLLHDAQRMVQLTFNKDSVRSHYLISPWTAAQQEFGKKAIHYHTCVERLLDDTLEKKPVAEKDVGTNLMRYLSLKYVVPLGVDDARKIQGDISFHISKIGSEKELVYADQKSVLGKKLDYWQSPRTRPAANSTALLVHLEALPPLTNRKVREILVELQSLIYTFCGGKTKIVLLHRRKPSVQLSIF